MYAVPVRAVIASEWTLLGLCLGFISARLYLRLRVQRRRLIPSDYILSLAFLSAVASAVLDIRLMQLGWLSSESTWFDPHENPSEGKLSRRIAYTSWFLMLGVQYLTKAALLAFYFYIFPSALLCFVVFLWIAPSAECSIRASFILWITTWLLHFSSDVFIFILPFPILRTLHLSWKKKVGVYVTFGFGLLSIVASILRFSLVVSTYYHVPTTNLELLCALDSNAGLVAACIPSLRPYLNIRRGSSQRKRTPSPSMRQATTDSSLLSAQIDAVSIPPEVYSRGNSRLDSEVG